MAAIRFRILPQTHDQTLRDKQQRDFNKWILVLLFLLPGMLIFFTFLLVPIAESMPLSLFKWNGLGPLTDYRQLDNYAELLNNKLFQNSIIHSFVLMILSLAVQLPLALGLALMLGRGDLLGRKMFRSLLFIPFVFSDILTANIWLYVLKPENGLLNMVLKTVPGFQPVGWLGDFTWVLPAIFLVITWKYFGFHMILYMAGLQSIPKDLEEAARVDGATEASVLRYITLPLLGSTIRLSVFLSVLGSFQTFVIIWILTQGGPVGASSVIATFLYEYGIKRFNLGYGSAIAVILFIITLFFSIGYQRIILRRDYAPDAK